MDTQPPDGVMPDRWAEMNRNIMALVDQRKVGEAVVVNPEQKEPEVPSMPKTMVDPGEAEIARGLRTLAGEAPAKTPEPKEDKGKREPIPGTPFYTVEALGEAYKHAQAKINEVTLALREKEAKLNEAAKREPIDIQAEVRKALSEARKPEYDPEADAKLKEDDPVKWEIEQAKREARTAKRELEAQLAELKANLEALAEARQLKEIESEFREASEATGIPYELLLGVGNSEKFRGKNAAAIAEEFKPVLLSMLEKMVGKKPDAPASPATPGQPISRGAAAVVEKPLTEEEVGPIGGEKWRKQTLPNIIRMIKQQARG